MLDSRILFTSSDNILQLLEVIQWSVGNDDVETKWMVMDCGTKEDWG